MSNSFLIMVFKARNGLALGGCLPFSYSSILGAQPGVVMEKVAAEVRLELLNLPVPLFLSGNKNNTPKGLLDYCVWNL